MQSHWWARLAFFLFQYSRKVTARRKIIRSSPSTFLRTPEGHEDRVEDSAGVVKEVGDPGVGADVVEGPGGALLALGAHAQAEESR